jgi:hypothetical protein
LCGERSSPAGCHSTPQPGAPRVTDCCSAHSPEGSQQALTIDASAPVRVDTGIATATLEPPELALSISIEPQPARSLRISLFTLHRSLLL